MSRLTLDVGDAEVAALDGGHEVRRLLRDLGDDSFAAKEGLPAADSHVRGHSLLGFRLPCLRCPVVANCRQRGAGLVATSERSEFLAIRNCGKVGLNLLSQDHLLTVGQMPAINVEADRQDPLFLGRQTRDDLLRVLDAEGVRDHGPVVAVLAGGGGAE